MTTRTPQAKTTDVAKVIRRELAAAFPDTKFSVRSRTSGTDAIMVEWADGPTSDRVKAIVGCYQHGEFDGMTDSYTYHGGKMVNGVEHGVRWLQTQRSMSEAAETRFMALIMQYRGDLDGMRDYEIANLAWREFVKWDGSKEELPATTSDLPSAREWRTTR